MSSISAIRACLACLFTVAVSITADEDKLAVTDNIAKHLTDYPAHGREITIAHLLTHTSGIKNYTELPGFEQAKAVDKTPQEVIDTFKSESLEFEPGERSSYSNSGHFLLGTIIEKGSGVPYAEFMAKRI